MFIVEKVTANHTGDDGIENLWGFTGIDHGIRVHAGPIIFNPGNSEDYTNGTGGAMYVNGALAAGNATAGSAQLFEAYAGPAGPLSPGPRPR